MEKVSRPSSWQTVSIHLLPLRPTETTHSRQVCGPDSHSIREAAALDGADVVDGGIEEEVDLLLQLLIEVFQHDEVDVRAEMADGGIEQVELVLDAELF